MTRNPLFYKDCAFFVSASNGVELGNVGIEMTAFLPAFTPNQSAPPALVNGLLLTHGK
jgi:hypothetical protein